MLRHGEKKCVCWFKNNGKKQHKRPQVSSHLSCKTSADRTVQEFFHYPLNSPEDDYKKQPEEHGNHCSANKDNELQICFLFSAWEEINEYLSDSWKRIGFVHSLKYIMEVLVLKVRFKSATWSKETKAKQNKKLGFLCWNITFSFMLLYTPPYFLASALFQGQYLDLWQI